MITYIYVYLYIHTQKYMHTHVCLQKMRMCMCLNLIPRIKSVPGIKAQETIKGKISTKCHV